MSTVKSSSANLTLNADGSGNDVIIQSNASTKAIVTAEGNVGIGVTPESWHASYTALQVGAGGSIADWDGTDNGLYLGANWYYDDADRYIETNEATNYIQEAGIHRFKVASSGSADAAISWTTAMTIANDGTVTKPSQPAFAVNIASDLVDVVGGEVDYDIGANSTATESYDVGGNITNFLFTAPVTGKYHLSGALAMEGAVSGNEYGFGQLKTSNRTYMFAHSYDWWDWFGDDGGSWICQCPFSFVVDMDAGDTAKLRVKIWGGATTIDIIGSTMLQGYLLG